MLLFSFDKDSLQIVKENVFDIILNATSKEPPFSLEHDDNLKYGETTKMLN